MITYKHTFTQTEKEILDLIADLRYKATSRETIERQQNKKFPAEEIVKRGVYSEYVVSKYLNLHMNLDCNYRYDFGADLITRGGQTIDVKCTDLEHGGIATVPWTDRKDADIFIGTYAPRDLSFCEVFGYMMREDLIKPSMLRTMKTADGDKEFYLVAKKEVKTFNDHRH